MADLYFSFRTNGEILEFESGGVWTPLTRDLTRMQKSLVTNLQTVVNGLLAMAPAENYALKNKTLVNMTRVQLKWVVQALDRPVPPCGSADDLREVIGLGALDADELRRALDQIATKFITEGGNKKIARGLAKIYAVLPPGSKVNTEDVRAKLGLQFI